MSQFLLSWGQTHPSSDVASVDRDRRGVASCVFIPSVKRGD